MLIGRRIDPGLETDTVKAPVVPPLPSRQSGPYPRHVFQARRFGEAHDHVVVEQLPVFTGNEDRPPRKRSPGCGFGDEIGILVHDVLKIVVSAVVRTFRIGCENSAQGSALTRIIEIHARIGLQVGLGKAEFHAIIGRHDQRQESQPRWIEFREPGYGIKVLERGLELAPERYDLGSVTIPHIGNPARPVSRETGARLFGNDDQRFIRRGDKTVSDPVVVGPELEGKTLPEIGPQPVIAIRNPLLDIKRRGERGIGRPFANPGRLRRAAPYGPVVQRHRDRRRRHDRAAVHMDLISEALPERQCDPDRPVGRRDRITLFAGDSNPRKQCK